MAAPRPHYRERLTAPPSWWALALLFGVAVGWAFYVATPAWVALVALLIGTAVAVAVVASYGSATVEVSSEGFRAGRALLPRSAVGDVRALDRDGARRAAGVEVRVEVDDPADPTPYWLVSSRHPEAVVSAIRAAPVQD
jgi:DUF3093 family protein